MKKIITFALASILALTPVIVSAKVPVSDVGGIVIIGNKGYSMNYLMQTLNETQITEIRQDLNSPSATHLYFKLSDNDKNWIDAFDSTIYVDDTELKNQVGNDITVVDVTGRKSVKIIDTDSSNTPSILQSDITISDSPIVGYKVVIIKLQVSDPSQYGISYQDTTFRYYSNNKTFMAIVKDNENLTQPTSYSVTLN